MSPPPLRQVKTLRSKLVDETVVATVSEQLQLFLRRLQYAFTAMLTLWIETVLVNGHSSTKWRNRAIASAATDRALSRPTITAGGDVTARCARNSLSSFSRNSGGRRELLLPFNWTNYFRGCDISRQYASVVIYLFVYKKESVETMGLLN